MLGIEVIERHQGRQDVHLVFPGDVDEAVKVGPIGRCGARDMSLLVDLDSEISAAREPDPRRIDSAIVEQLKVGIPPVRIEITSQVVPMMPRCICAVYPDSVAPNNEPSTRNRDPLVWFVGTGRGRSSSRMPSLDRGCDQRYSKAAEHRSHSNHKLTPRLRAAT